MHFGGKKHIDGIWATKDIDFRAAIFLPLWSGIVGHRVCVVDITYEFLVGEIILNILRPKVILLQ